MPADRVHEGQFAIHRRVPVVRVRHLRKTGTAGFQPLGGRFGRASQCLKTADGVQKGGLRGLKNAKTATRKGVF